jgi:death-on-curing protein
LQNPKFPSILSVKRIHAAQINRFGGSPGIRDQGLLESALAQPQTTFDGKLLHSSIHEQAAAYLYHLAMNHPFVDGNKRTAFATMDSFLRLNGYALNISKEEAYKLVIEIVEGEIDKAQLSEQIEKAIMQVNK